MNFAPIKKLFFSFAVVLLFLTACAAPQSMTPLGSNEEIEAERRIQQRLVLEQGIKENTHVQTIGYKILKANADICPVTDTYLGMPLWSKYQFPKTMWPMLEESFALGDGVTVQSLVKGGAAERAGMRTGDVIVSVNDISIPMDKNGMKVLSGAFEKIKEDKVTLGFLRNGQQRSLNIRGDKLCNYGVIYDSNSQEVNAYADGKNIYITRGMYRFTNDETELALVIAHEIAHNTMDHVSKKTQNALGGGLLGLAVDILAAAGGVNTGGDFTRIGMQAGGAQYSVEFEQEADYVGLYYMARSGYNTAGVANFWRRMAAELSGGSISSRSTHPTSPERFLAIEKTHQEIKAKKARGEKLLPNLKTE